MPKNRKEAIIITGGAGFIGNAICKRLKQSGRAIVAIDNLHPQIHLGSRPPEDFPECVTLRVGDVTDSEMWDAVFAQWYPKVVVHLAAETGTGQSLKEATRHANVNVVGTAVMLDACVRCDAVPQHIVLASSRAVYGEGAWMDARGCVFYPQPRSHDMLSAARWNPVSIDGDQGISPLANCAATVDPRPTSIYGATKLAQENILAAWCGALGTSLSVFRLQNVYGPGQSPFNPYTGIITLFHRQARKGEILDVYEDGEIGRDFVYIDDVVDAFLAGLSHPASGVRTLDVGSGQTTTICEAARIIAQMHGAPDPIVCGKFRDGDVRSATADVGPLKTALGVVARTKFVDGASGVGEWLVKKGYA